MPIPVSTDGGTVFKLNDAEKKEHQRRKNQRHMNEAMQKQLDDQQKEIDDLKHTVARMGSQSNLALTRLAVLESKQRRNR